MSTYQPEWARPDRPTAGMKDAEVLAFYKAHAVAGDCRFSLREGSGVPVQIQAQWAQLLEAVTYQKETPSHRKDAARLRAAWRQWRDLIERRPAMAGVFLAELPASPFATSDLKVRSGATPATNWKARALAAEAQLSDIRHSQAKFTDRSSAARKAWDTRRRLAAESAA